MKGDEDVNAKYRHRYLKKHVWFTELKSKTEAEHKLDSSWK